MCRSRFRLVSGSQHGHEGSLREIVFHIGNSPKVRKEVLIRENVDPFVVWKLFAACVVVGMVGLSCDGVC